MNTASKIFKRFLLFQVVLVVLIAPATALALPFQSLSVTSTVTQGTPDKEGGVMQSASIVAGIMLNKEGTINPKTDAITLRLQVAGIVDPDVGDWDLPNPSWLIVSIPAGSLTQVDYYTFTLKKGAPVDIVLVDAYGDTLYDYKKNITSQSVKLFLYYQYASLQIDAKAFFEGNPLPEPPSVEGTVDPYDGWGIADPDLPDNTLPIPNWLIVGSASHSLLTIGDNYGTVHTYQVKNQGAY